jgi:hypothetical protein
MCTHASLLCIAQHTRHMKYCFLYVRKLLITSDLHIGGLSDNCQCLLASYVCWNIWSETKQQIIYAEVNKHNQWTVFNTNIFPINVVAEWLELLLCVLKVLNPNHGPETSCPVWVFSYVLSASPGRCWDSTLDHTVTASFYILSNSLFSNHPTIWQ